MNEFKDYKGLLPSNEYDKEKAELLAEAMTEKIKLEKRINYLETLIDDNTALIPFLWTTLQGECKALHKLTDSHLTNIMKHLLTTGRKISKEIQAEARSRGIEVPDYNLFTTQKLLQAQEAEVLDDVIDWLDD